MADPLTNEQLATELGALAGRLRGSTLNDLTATKRRIVRRVSPEELELLVEAGRRLIRIQEPAADPRPTRGVGQEEG